MQLSPSTVKMLKRFRSIRRGYYSCLLFFALLGLSMCAELLINSRALVVKYEGKLFFPTYSAMIPGRTFDLDYDYETNYRDLARKFKDEHSNHFVLLPIIPYNPFENDLREGFSPPEAPSWERKHFLGTDASGRDILARLVYGFRISIAFSLILLLINYIIGIAIGSAMGYFGGWFDLLFQRLIEIWSHLPFLYVIMIIASVVKPSLFSLVGIMVFFGWMGMTWQMRTATYKEKEREYISAAKALGASSFRVIFTHILPNTVSMIITFVPFSISSGIVTLSMLDYLGFGLPAPTPSWGELLRQGTANLNAHWISFSVVTAMVVVLTMVTFIGEAVREAFDPRKFSTYE